MGCEVWPETVKGWAAAGTGKTRNGLKRIIDALFGWGGFGRTI